jgi:hypothetical protein
MALVFQYGSNADPNRLNSHDRLRGDARSVGTAYTEDSFQLDFTVWSDRNNCAAADIVPGGGRTIWGVLYEVPDFLIRRDTAGDRRSLDAIEGEGTNYERVPIRLRRPDATRIEQEVITYIVINRRFGLQTSLEYVRHIIVGLRAHNVPGEYVEYVKERVTTSNPTLTGEIAGL